MAGKKEAAKRRTSKPKAPRQRAGRSPRVERYPLTPKERLEFIDRMVAGETIVGALRSMCLKTNNLLKTFDIDPKFEGSMREARRLKAYLQAERAERITGHFFNDEGGIEEGQAIALFGATKQEVVLRRNAAEHLRWLAERGNPDAFGQKIDVGASDRTGKSWADLAIEEEKESS